MTSKVESERLIGVVLGDSEEHEELVPAKLQLRRDERAKVETQRPARTLAKSLPLVNDGAAADPQAAASALQRKYRAGAALLVLITMSPLLANMAKDPVTSEYPFDQTVAVLMVDTLKLLLAASLYLMNFGLQSPLEKSGYASWSEFLKKSAYFSVPALLYAVSNNLDYLALSLLNAADYQLLTNLKILTTAVLSWLFLAKRISTLQWAALGLLTSGAMVSQLGNFSSDDADAESDPAAAQRFFGALVLVFQTVISSSAGIWTEYVMKGRGLVKDQPIHLQNFQLYAWGVPVDIIIISMRRTQSISTLGGGIFSGFGFWGTAVVLSNVFYGFSVSFVMKYADNIVKLFIGCVATLVVAVLSSWLFNTPLTVLWGIAVLLISSAVALYVKGAEAHK